MHPSSMTAAALALALTACSATSRVDLVRVATHGRDGWQHPERVIEALAIELGDTVAEIGPGEGYWIPWLSRAAGPTGRVFAVDVDDEAIAALRALVEREQLANVEVVRGEFHDPLLPDGELDLVMTSLTYHHLDDRPAYFRSLTADLRADGRVAHLDDRSDLGPILTLLLTDEHWSDPESVRAEMEQAGYARVAAFDFLLTQSFQVFAIESSRGADNS